MLTGETILAFWIGVATGLCIFMLIAVTVGIVRRYRVKQDLKRDPLAEMIRESPKGWRE